MCRDQEAIQEIEQLIKSAGLDENVTEQELDEMRQQMMNLLEGFEPNNCGK